MPPQDTAGGPKTVIHSLMVDWVREGFAVCVCVYVLVCERERECVCTCEQADIKSCHPLSQRSEKVQILII